MFDRRSVLKSASALPLLSLPGCVSATGKALPEPGWESLTQGFRVPEWFRDAKFGIWAHWGPQCVPEFGDWYGRLMYMQGSPFYEHHVRTYGHPSRFGFMEFNNLWKAESWDPDYLIGLYKRAGARYFMTMANHHDNLDMYDSAHHAWNTVNMGPKRDIVGTWEKIARREGLRFGVSNHSSHAWHWWQTAYGYDATGPMQGVRYDAFRLSKVDGKGKWWEGFDPQDLYTGPNIVAPDGIDSIAAMNKWHDDNSGQWIETPPPDNPRFVQKWLMRQQNLVERYRPDMVYFDNTALPFGDVGVEAAAHYYALSRRWSGDLDVVVTGKKLSELQRRAIVEDVERGFSDHLRPEPWQTCTCIGNWHYDRPLYERHGYKPAGEVIQRLCDVVSKNGNLLLSVPQRGDGTIDDDELAIVEAIGRWMAVNGEAIYGSRPWRIYGEGPTRPQAGMQNEDKARPFTSRDVRFTVKGGALNAFFLDWPQGDGRIEALGGGALPDAVIERVELIGGGPLPFRRDGAALVVTLPEAAKGSFVPGVTVRGRGIV